MVIAIELKRAHVNFVVIGVRADEQNVQCAGAEMHQRNHPQAVAAHVKYQPVGGYVVGIPIRLLHGQKVLPVGGTGHVVPLIQGFGATGIPNGRCFHRRFSQYYHTITDSVIL